MGITWGTTEIIELVSVALTLLLLGILIGLYIDRFRNPIRKLKKDTVYLQGELDPFHLLLRKSKENAELKLYKINGTNRTKMPKIFAVTDKAENTYTIVSYDPIIIGGSSNELSNEVSN